MLAILDYKAGNQTSVARALQHLGIECTITAKAADIEAAEGVIFPGVGAARQAMAELARTGLDAHLRRAVAQGQPLLGICLGCQILLEHSEEEDTPCLGILKGRCRRFAPGLMQEDGTPAPIPHMGWNSLRVVRPNRLFDGIEPGSEFYFVHSYYVEVEPELELASTTYGHPFCAVYGRDGLWAVQCHMEKSGRPGLRILQNFYDYCRESAGKGASHA